MVVRGHPVNKTREYSGTGVNEREVGSFDWDVEYWGTTVFIWVLIAFVHLSFVGGGRGVCERNSFTNSLIQC